LFWGKIHGKILCSTFFVNNLLTWECTYISTHLIMAN
jgi:hypothetical protein